jgi:hypothetical protein
MAGLGAGFPPQIEDPHIALATVHGAIVAGIVMRAMPEGLDHEVVEAEQQNDQINSSNSISYVDIAN